MFKKKNLKKLGQIVCLVLVIALVGAIVVGVTASVRSQTETLSPTIFSTGAIDKETGNYVASDKSIYTKDKISCIGLNVVPDFEATSSYQIFWYNMDGAYIGYSRVYNPGQEFANAVPSNAWYCRIVITPSNLDGEGKVNEDFKINFFDTFGYASAFTIKVDKKQDRQVHNIYNNAVVYSFEGEYDALNTISLLAKYNGAFIMEDSWVNDLNNPDTCDVIDYVDKHLLFVDVSNISNLYIENNDEIVVHLFCYNEDAGTISKSGYYSINGGENLLNDISFNLSDFAVIAINSDDRIDLNVYNYLPRTVGQID